MNVEIRAEATQFPEKEYINGIFLAVCRRVVVPAYPHASPWWAGTTTLCQSRPYIRQSGTKNLASKFYITPFFPTQFLKNPCNNKYSTNQSQPCDWGSLHGSYTFSRSAEDVTEVISIHRHNGEIPGYFVSGMMNDDM
jgi:hypothetical protein